MTKEKSIGQQVNFDPIVPKTLVDSVVEAIIFAAAEGQIKPGERVVEAELSRQLDISRVPVREALRLLESQGIVENTPYRGMRLMQVDNSQIENTIKVRFALERLAAEEYLAAAAKGAVDLTPLERCVDQMRIAARYDDSYRVALSDTEFHRTLCGLTGNNVLLDTWQPLSRKMIIIFGIAAVQKGLDSIVEEHVELLEALKQKDRKVIFAMLKEHIFAYLHLRRIQHDDEKPTKNGGVRPTRAQRSMHNDF